MQIHKLLVLILLGLNLTAVADFRTVTEVHEVDLMLLRLPASLNGTLSFAGCADCDSQTLRVNRATRYVINGRTLPLADFRRAVAGITKRREANVDVYHHLESDTATKVRVTL